ncbi:hypothetical protein [Sodalis ligni]|uniref:DUF551 domain-containing protein n=1 Tax=Sodalis ligni TaxID=2697027 RepID=A0A4R1NID1_9GAMM|nr:hypothetical protein [Sodalis ligni]TCL06847.1 hypothetical protein EZJ58_5144 [Sodalis ligni]
MSRITYVVEYPDGQEPPVHVNMDVAGGHPVAFRFGDALAEPVARPLPVWNEDLGDVVWWCWENGEWLGEAAWIGTPNDRAWPGYHTHWTPHPVFPADIPPTDNLEGQDHD